MYLIAPLLISVGSWRWVFIGSAAAGILMCFVWNRYPYEIPVKRQAAATGTKESRNPSVIRNYRKERCFFCIAVSASYSLHARCKPDADLHDPALLQEVQKCFDRIRRTELLYIRRKYSIHLRNRSIVGEDRMEQDNLCVVSDCAWRGGAVFWMCEGAEDIRYLENVNHLMNYTRKSRKNCSNA